MADVPAPPIPARGESPASPAGSAMPDRSVGRVPVHDDRATLHRAEHRLGEWLERRPRNRVLYGAVMGLVSLAAKVLLNGITGQDTGFIAYYLGVAATAATGGMSAGITATAMIVAGQTLIFYEPVGTLLIANAANSIRLALFAFTGIVVSLITNGLLQARLRAEAAGGEMTRLYDAEASARREAEAARRRTQEAADRAELQGAQLQGITTALSQPLTQDAVADVWTTHAIAALGATGGGVALVDRDGATVRTFRTLGLDRDVMQAFETFVITDAVPVAAALRSHRAVFCGTPADIARDYPAVIADAAALGTSAFVAVPFPAESSVRGAVFLSFASQRAFPASERSFLTAIAKECGQALLRARLLAAAQGARTEAEASRAALGFLAEASRILASSLSYESTLPRVADLAVPILADWCAVDLVELDGTVHAVASPQEPGRSVDRRAATVIETGEPLIIPSVAPADGDGGSSAVVRSYLAVPLLTSEGVLGTISFGSSVDGRYATADLAIAQDLARRVSDAIRHARLYREARQLVATVDATLDAVFMFEPAHLRFTYVNQGAVNQVGYGRDALLAMRALDIKPDFDEAGYRELIAPLLAGTRPSITFSTTHLHRDGTRVPVEVFLQAVRLPGDTVRMIVTARDIRQQIDVEANLYRLARAERARAAELSAVIRGMGEGVLVCDPAGQVILSNPAAASIMTSAIDRYEDLVDLVEPPAEGLPPLGSAAGPVEARLAGTDRWVDVSTYPVSLESTEAFGDSETTIIVLRDVTAARQARAAREAFIGVMSHELRTPITTIYGTTKLFGKATDSPELMKSMLSDVEEEADRLYRLVEDLLILSRSETGIQVEGEPVLLQHVVRSVMAAEGARWPMTDFVSLLPAGLPPVSGDRTHLEQVVRNLLSNAAKYSPPGTLVQVTAELGDGDLTVRVLDAGPGIAEEEARHLFELFYRSPTTSRKAVGAGIGLYVTRALIEAMGGRIWAKPRPEGGAEFGFTVPVLDVDAEFDDTDDMDDLILLPGDESRPG